MRRPGFVFASLLVALCASACGVIAGLGDYAAGVADAGAHPVGQGHLPDESAAPTDDAVVTGGPGDDVGMGPGEADDAPTGGAADDATDGGNVGGEVDAADAGEDAAAACRAQCGGCCDNDSVCHGGQSLATCGSGGRACTDCSTSGKICSSAGACVVDSPAEAGPPPQCSLVNCKNQCPLLEAPCCKQDQTCGCAVLGLLLCN